MRDARVLGHVGQEPVQDLGGFLLAGVGLVRRGGRAQDRERVKDSRLSIVRILPVDALHSRFEGERAGPVIELVSVPVVGLGGGDVIPLALGSRVRRDGLRDGLASLSQLRGTRLPARIACRPDGMEIRHRDAPVRHRACGVRLGDFEESLLRRVVPERMEKRHAALELLPRRGVARDGKIDFAQPLRRASVLVLMRLVGETGERGESEEQESDASGNLHFVLPDHLRFYLAGPQQAVQSESRRETAASGQKDLAWRELLDQGHHRSARAKPAFSDACREHAITPHRRTDPNNLSYFFAGAFPASTGLRSNLPPLSTKNTQSEAWSQVVVWR